MPPCRNAVYELMSEDGLDRKGNSLRNIVNFSDRVRAAAEATQSRRWFVDLPACSHNAASHATARGGYLTNVLTPYREARIPRMVGWLETAGLLSGQSQYLQPHVWRCLVQRRAPVAKGNPTSLRWTFAAGSCAQLGPPNARTPSRTYAPRGRAWVSASPKGRSS